MKQNKSYKFRIYPNKEQQVLFAKTFGSNRFVWNNALSYKNDLYNSRKEFYNKYDSIKDLSQIKKIDEYSWLKEVDSQSLQQTLFDLDLAFKSLYRKIKKGLPTSVRFKNRDSKQSYRTNNINNSIRVNFNDKRIKLPKLGFVKFKDKRQFIDNIKSTTISKTKTGKYFVSLLVEYDFESNKPNTINISKVFSADMSAKNFMISEEMEFENQRFYRNSERRLRIRQRRLSNKVKGSNNRIKQKLRVASYHELITNRRRGFQRNLIHELITKFDVFCFEDLNTKGMQQFSKGLSKTVSLDFSWSEFLNFFEWKAFKHNKHFTKIDRWFPSSKMCSECGTINEDLKLSDRTYKCDCGLEIDRDINASRNIKKVGLDQLIDLGINLIKNSTDLMSESYACGDTMNDVSCSAQESTTL